MSARPIFIELYITILHRSIPHPQPQPLSQGARGASCKTGLTSSFVIINRNPTRLRQEMAHHYQLIYWVDAALGATVTPCTLLLSIARATNPAAFTSSINSRKYFAPASRPLGVPAAC